jgi:thioredoxin 1
MFAHRSASILIVGAALFFAGCSREPEGPEQIFYSPTKEQFTKILKDHRVVLVDFQADWCGPCREMKPIVRRVEKTYRGRVALVEIDIDKRPDLARDFGVKAIPRFFVIRGGEPVSALSGVVSRGELEAALAKALRD